MNLIQIILIVFMGLVPFIPSRWINAKDPNANPKKAKKLKIILVSLFAIALIANFFIDKSKEKKEKEAKSFTLRVNELHNIIAQNTSDLYRAYSDLYSDQSTLVSIESQIETNSSLVDEFEETIPTYRKIYDDYNKSKPPNATFKEIFEEGKKDALEQIKELKGEIEEAKLEIEELNKTKEELEAEIISKREIFINHETYKEMLTNTKKFFEIVGSEQLEVVIQKQKKWKELLDNDKIEFYHKKVEDLRVEFMGIISAEKHKALLKYGT